MHVGFHHYQKHQKTQDELEAHQLKLNQIVDKIIYIIGAVGVLIFLPQLIQVWSPGPIDGVSLLSWSGMFGASIFWLLYGLVHKARPIIFINTLAAAVQLLVVVGIIFHS